tara:strand:+ start:1197 stop:2219 length:1023 start_codon:yes stop_codon:yes gene_type:complete
MSHASKGLSGLVNFGNTCYMNSAIQCLSNVEILRDYFLDKDFLEDLNKEKEELSLVVNWYKLLNHMWSGNNTIAPKNFRQDIRIMAFKGGINYNLVGNGQNDVQEFIQFFISSLHNCLSRKVQMTINGKIINDLDKKAFEAMKSWKTFFKDDYSFIVEKFYSQHSSSIYDLNKNLKSTIYEPICYYTLPIPNKENIDLYDCLDLYTDLEKMNEENKWYDEKNKEYIECYKEIKFWSTPKVLIIVLKRFLNDGSKISNLIDFPIKNLNINKYCVGYSKRSNIYDLVGISNHIGNLNSGHYYAYCKNIEDNKWYEFNDTNVRKMNKEEIITENAYCLFYVKK